MVKKNILLLLLVLFGLAFTACSDVKNTPNSNEVTNQANNNAEDQNTQTEVQTEDEVLNNTFSEADQVDSDVEIGELI